MNARTQRNFSSVLPTRDTVRLMVAPTLVFIVVCVDRGYQTDFWQHLARGREIVKAGWILNADPFTFTAPGKPMADGNWLSQVLYFALHQLGGLPLVQLVNALVLATAMMILVRIARRLSRSTGVATLAGIFALAGISQTILIRPQSFSILLFMILFATLLRIRDGASRRWLIVPPVIVGLWANVHGGFAIGLMLIAAFAAEAFLRRLSRFGYRPPSPLYSGERAGVRGSSREARGAFENISTSTQSPSPDLSPEYRGEEQEAVRLSFVLTASIYATFVNPLGLRVYTYAVGLSSKGISRGIEEWCAPSLHLWIGWAFYASLLLLAGVLIASKKRPKLLHLALIVCFLPPAMKAVRMVAWWFLIVAPILASIAGEWISTRKSSNRTIPIMRPSFSAAACVAVLFLAALSSVPSLERFSPVFALRSAHRTEDDLAAVSELLNRAATTNVSPDRVFTRMEWGNYLCWSAYPNYRVYMEGHVEIYDDAVWNEYTTITAGADPTWGRSFERRGVQVMVLDDVYHAKLLKNAVASGGWSSVMHRPGMTVLARTGSPIANAIRAAIGGSSEKITDDDRPISDPMSTGVAHISPDGR